MGLREKINENQALSGVIAVVFVVAAIAGLWYSMQPASHSKPTKAFYTVDEGQTLFSDSLNKLTPFDYGGKEAVKAYVYTCDNGKTQFVAYLEKMPPGAKPVVVEETPAAPRVAAKSEAEARANAAAAAAAAAKQAPRGPTFVALVKKPGDKEWLKPGSPGYFAIVAAKCPDASGRIDLVVP